MFYNKVFDYAQEEESLIRKLMKSIRQYTKDTVLSLVFIIGEVILEVVIPFITAYMVNMIQDNAGMDTILKIGGVITVAAIGTVKPTPKMKHTHTESFVVFFQ